MAKNDNNILNITDSEYFNSHIIEETQDIFGKKYIRLKQDLIEADLIINEIKNYYATICDDGSIIINRSIIYPYIKNTKIINYEHISRRYSGAVVDLVEFIILLENNQTIKTRIFSPYESINNGGIYYFSNNNYLATKGYYEYGNAINALKNNPLEIIKNNNNIEITIFSDYNNENYHKYLYLGPISKYYNSEYNKVTDIYRYFILDIYSAENTKEMEIYYNEIIEKIKYW
jgi:hypothetical protein